MHERGRFVGWVGFEPLGSWRELQQHLHRHIAIAYHRNRHGGVKIPGVEDGNFTPLERHDMLHAITGRLLVPQHPDLIYSLLPGEVAHPRQRRRRLPRPHLRRRHPRRDPRPPAREPSVPRTPRSPSTTTPATAPDSGTAAATTTASTSCNGATRTWSRRP
ncbi:MAG: hypothetical protein V9G15_14235 [Dermatophilaceae bacterium]